MATAWAAALDTLAAHLDEAECRLDIADPDDGGWNADLAVEPLPVGVQWTAEERRRAKQLLARLAEVSTRMEAALGSVAAELGELTRRRSAASAYSRR